MTRIILYSLIICLLISSCGSSRLITQSVAYQSVRTSSLQAKSAADIPSDAKIVIAYTIDAEGNLSVVLYNRTSNIMTIDQTKSFFVNSTGESVSYYDPTVRATSKTSIQSDTKGASLNLGVLSSVLGVGGGLGMLSNGINLGGAGTIGTSMTETTYSADQPRVSLAPYSSGVMSKIFQVRNLGTNVLSDSREMNLLSLSSDKSYCKFKVCISYSLDGENSFDTIVTDFYANSLVVAPVERHGSVNDALRSIYLAKPDALNEWWWMLYFNSQTGSKMVNGVLFDYK